jgi:hypothetical protein
LPTTNNIEDLTATINFENGFNEALIYVNVVNSGVQRKFTTLVFSNVYRQKGANINGLPAELRTISPNIENIPELTGSENNWLLKFGDLYKDFTDYGDNYPFQSLGIYRFGFDANNQPGEITLLITNQGDANVEIDGINYNPGDTCEIAISGSEFQITLPSNAGFSQNPSDFSQFQEFNLNGIYTESVYEFSIKNNGQTYIIGGLSQVFYRHNFTPLDNLNEAGSTLFKLGSFSLPNFNSPIESLSSPKYLTTYYNNVLTRYNGSQCTSNFIIPDNVFNIRVLGVILLDGSNNESTYVDAEFIDFNDFNPICGEINNEQSNPAWLGVPFEVV